MISKYICFSGIFLTMISVAHATEIDKNTAVLQAMDKITGRVSMVEVPVNGEAKFGSLSIITRSCKTRPAEETPDNFVFIDITDTDLKGEEKNVFKGWMISSSPATHALEHPIYDIWLLRCIDTSIDKNKLLSEEQLRTRDNLPTLQKADTVKVTTENAESVQKPSKLSDIIHEMQSENTNENSPQEIIMPNEFSFDEDEGSDEISAKHDDLSEEISE